MLPPISHERQIQRSFDKVFLVSRRRVTIGSSGEEYFLPLEFHRHDNNRGPCFRVFVLIDAATGYFVLVHVRRSVHDRVPQQLPFTLCSVQDGGPTSCQPGVALLRLQGLPWLLSGSL